MSKSTILFALLVVIAFCHTAVSGSGTRCLYNPEGTCMSMFFYNCPAGYKVSSRGCGFREICCYPNVEKLPTFSYGDDSCGISTTNSKSKIVGGTTATIGEYPWMASIQKYNQPVCGGSIIGDRWILTAAHCVTKHSDAISVVIGSTYSNPSWNSYGKRHYVSKILSHSGYDKYRTERGNDIALLKLERPIDLGGTLTRKVCLPDSYESFTDNMCVVVGWGYTHEPVGPATSSGGSPRLRQANIPVLSQGLCNYYVPGMSYNAICAGYRAGGIDSCQGDSGGPMVCQGKDGVWKQAGIVSYGHGCARQSKMGVYTDVAKFTSWIESAMKNY